MSDGLTQETYAELQQHILDALQIAEEFGQCDGAHHKAWVIDAMVRALIGNTDDYDAWIDAYRWGEDGEHTYTWDEGIAP